MFVLHLFLLADDTVLAAAEDLEGVALLNVHGGAAPYLGLGTFAAAIDAQSLAQHVHALFVEDDAGVALGDVIAVVVVKDVVAFLLSLEDIKDLVSVEQGAFHVDDHVAVDVTALAAAAIDVTAQEAAALVGIGGNSVRQLRA